MNKVILLCIRNGLMADGMVSMISQRNTHIKLTEERNPELFNTLVAIHKPDVIVIEVKGIRPFTLAEWLVRIKKIKEILPRCKIAMIVDDENYPETAEFVKKEKISGEIDTFFYASSGLNYLVDAIDSL